MQVSRRSFVVSTAAGAGAVLLAPAILSQKNDWKDVRALFNLDPAWTHAALFYFASHPRPVRDAIDDYRRRLDADPYTTVEQAMFTSDANNIPLRACNAIAKFIGGSADDIALTSNTTTGLALVYHGLPLKSGDEILTTEHDHEVHHGAIDLAATRSGASVRKIALFPPHQARDVSVEGLVAKIRDAVRPNTRVVGITWVHSSSGVKLPLREIASAVKQVNAKTLVVVDGVHGFGATNGEIATSGIDAFSAGLHKWMFGPRGTGFVWAKPNVWEQMHPMLPTFSSFELYMAWVEKRAPHGPARANWFTPGGFQSYEHQWAIPSAFALHESIGHERIVARIAELNGMAKKALASMKHVRLHTPMSPALSAGINCFEVNGVGGEEVVARLRKAKVIASTSPYAVSYPRLSFGIANDEKDVERAIDALDMMKA